MNAEIYYPGIFCRNKSTAQGRVFYLVYSNTSDESVMLSSNSAQAPADAWRNFLNGLLTEPMTITELATEWFKVGRNKMALMLKAMDGVERCGATYRVPLVKMPPKYLVSRGILPVVTDSE